MRVPIDASGRVVVPKTIRDELGIAGAMHLEVAARDGVIELWVTDVNARVEERAGGAVIVVDGSVPPLTAEAAREAIDRVRR